MLMLLTTTAFAQDQVLKLSGEAKTGIFWEQVQYQGREPEALQNPLRLESHDGDPNGNRFRLNMDYDNGKSFGFRARIDWENWSNTDSEQPKWKYAFAYSNFFEDQLTISIGKLGASPWGSGGPEKWKELEENSRGGGMRIEYKPGFIPEQYGRINAGFVLNWINSYDDSGETRTATIADILKESVLGISYTHDKFMARLAYRLDSNLDIRDRGTQELVTQLNGREGGDMVYRLEEYMLRNVVPGLQMWALGVYEGVFAADPVFYKFENWIFGQYDPPELFGLDTPFTAQIRVGYDYIESRSEFHVKPSFYWHFSPGGYSKLISVGGMFSYRQDFGKGKVWAGSPYQIIELEPKLQLNFSSSSIAFAYNWRQHYMGATWPEAEALGKDPIVRTQYINLRFCIYF
jgi:hypothetical protein